MRKPYAYFPETLFLQSGAGSQTYEWVYDSQGRVVECNDWSKSIHFEYNENGYVKMRQSSLLNDRSKILGTFDYQYQYTESGKPLIMTRTYNGRGGEDLQSGDIDTYSYQYENGLLTAVEEVKTRNGRTDHTTYYTLSYDAAGNLLSIRWYGDYRPEFRYYIYFEYENGVLAKTRYGNRELPETSEEYTLTTIRYKNGEPISVSSGSTTITFTYDENGSLVN